MRELIRYLRNYKKESIIGPLFKMLEASFELIVPLVMASIIDLGIGRENIAHIWKMCLVLIGLGVLGLVCSVIAQYCAAKAAMGFGTELRNDLFAHIHTLSYRELDSLGTPTLVTRMINDINQTQTGVNLVLRLFLRSPFIVIGAVMMAFTISIKITLIFIITVPVISLAIFLIIRATIPIYKRAQGILDRVSLLTRENHIGARVVRAFAKQEEEIQRFEETSEMLTKIQIVAGKISALLHPVTYVAVNLAIILILWSGSHEVYRGNISQGELVALVSYLTQILLALLALANLIIAFTKATASASRINEVFHTSSSIIEESKGVQKGNHTEPKVAFEQVSFSYTKAGEKTLENISFQIEGGETVGIIGGTGAGKSTLVNLIPRFYDVKDGCVKIEGISVKEYPIAQLRHKIGVVPQKAVLFQGSIRDNMKWGKEEASDEEIKTALTIAQAIEFVEEKEGGLDTQIQQGGRNLSGGQKQRLTIARALVGRPEILILDDSASALDFATDAALREALKKQTKDMTVFLVSQRVTSIRHADQILVLDDGKLVGIGTHQTLLADCDIYREICLSQLSREEAVR